MSSGTSAPKQTPSTNNEVRGFDGYIHDSVNSKLPLDAYPVEQDIQKYIDMGKCSNPNLDPVFLMRLAALARDYGNGQKIKFSDGASGLRTYDEQVRLYKATGGYQNENGEWVGGNGTAAKPGTSSHGFGVAVDVAAGWMWVNSSGTKKALINEDILAKYGLCRPDSRTVEIHHLAPIEVKGKSTADLKTYYDAYYNK